MKLQIRRGLFETNSSSTHSLTIVEDDMMKRWENGEVIYSVDTEKLVEIDENVKKYLHYRDIVNGKVEASDEEIEEAEDALDDEFYHAYATYADFKEGFLCGDELEDYYETYTTKHGDVVHVFGSYGNDY